jgi:hypothetical protein
MRAPEQIEPSSKKPQAGIGLGIDGRAGILIDADRQLHAAGARGAAPAPHSAREMPLVLRLQWRGDGR